MNFQDATSQFPAGVSPKVNELLASVECGYHKVNGNLTTFYHHHTGMVKIMTALTGSTNTSINYLSSKSTPLVHIMHAGGICKIKNPQLRRERDCLTACLHLYKLLVFIPSVRSLGQSPEQLPLKPLGLREKLTGLASASTVNILASDADLYVAAINDNLTMKIGPKTDLGNLIPSNFQVATSGTDHCVNQRQKGNSETGSASPKLHIIRPKTSEELRKYTSMVWMFFSRPSQCQSQALEEGNPIGNLLNVHIVNNIAPLNIPQ
ncbi:hypothetical protein NC653_032284 [Populus alba x Populus x berolinensis]|uniref:alpha-amylase n=1 Tax=Populus alba x Populus x berolinensis TaxID=444605 RepID=A0AAD6PZM5_9ROSI|nr:hypothetical protein NC653_032284 [Populus alba x Populus x berolinensis]